MHDVAKQIAIGVIVGVTTALLASGVSSLQHISNDIQKLNMGLAVVIEKIADHDRRIGKLENGT